MAINGLARVRSINLADRIPVGSTSLGVDASVSLAALLTFIIENYPSIGVPGLADLPDLGTVDLTTENAPLSNALSTLANLIALRQARLISGTNVKTIAGQSILGEGDIAATATAVIDSTTSTSTTAAASANTARVLATQITSVGATATNAANLAAGKLDAAAVGVANGVAPLNSAGQVPAGVLPSFVDDILEFSSRSAFPATGEQGKQYTSLAQDTVGGVSYPVGQTWRWSGSTYTPVIASPGTTDNVPEGSMAQYFTAARARAVPLTGLTPGARTAPLAADTLLQALAKLTAVVQGLPTIGGQSLLTATGDIPVGGGSSAPVPIAFPSTSTITVPLDTADPGKAFGAALGDVISIATSRSFVPPASNTRVERGVCSLFVVMDGTHTLTLDPSWLVLGTGASLVTSGQLSNTAGRKYQLVFAWQAGDLVCYVEPRFAVSAGGGDVTRPTLLSAVVSNDHKDRVVLTASEELDLTRLDVAQFAVSTNHPLAAIQAIDATHVYLRTSTLFAPGEAARTLAAAQTGSNSMRDLAGNLLLDFSGMAIANNLTPGLQDTAQRASLPASVPGPRSDAGGWNARHSGVWNVNSLGIGRTATNGDLLDADSLVLNPTSIQLEIYLGSTFQPYAIGIEFMSKGDDPSEVYYRYVFADRSDGQGGIVGDPRIFRNGLGGSNDSLAVDHQDGFAKERWVTVAITRNPSTGSANFVCTGFKGDGSPLTISDSNVPIPASGFGIFSLLSAGSDNSRFRNIVVTGA